MDRRIDASAILVAAAALLLVVALSLDWFGFRGPTGLTAWEAFEVLDLVLLFAAIAAVAAAFGRLDSRVLLAAAVVVVVVVVSQLVEPPPAAQGAEREVGAWLGLVAAAGLLAGAALVAAQIAVTVDVKGRERRRRVDAVDKRVAATPAAPAADATGWEGDPDATVADDSAVEPETGSRAMDPQATQAFAPPDEPAR